jgi:hypothetical protein
MLVVAVNRETDAGRTYLHSKRCPILFESIQQGVPPQKATRTYSQTNCEFKLSGGKEKDTDHGRQTRMGAMAISTNSFFAIEGLTVSKALANNDASMSS